MSPIELENLMRGAVARLGQLAEVIGVNLVFNPLAFLGCLFSVYLVTVVQTYEAYVFAPYVVGGSLAMVAKQGDLLHRKWGEYAAAEKESEKTSEAWKNPSIQVSGESRKNVLIANILAVAAFVLPVLICSYREIWLQTPNPILALVQILPSLAIILFSLWVWIGH